LGISLVVLIFFTALGVLVVLYTLHFRRRALAMGPERLLAALSRTVAGEEEASELELRQGASELEARLQRAFYAFSGLLAAVLIVCLVLTAMSTLPELSFALSGSCIFLGSLVLSIVLLRDIPRHISKQLERPPSDA
jgi:hypothetical protein